MDQRKYEAIMNMDHPSSLRHPRMSMSDRAAQFSPFAALTGHDEAIKETARVTDRKIELSEDEKAVLDRKMKIVEEHIGTSTMFRFIYFVPDATKDGGAYVPYDGSVKKIDLYHGVLVLSDHTVIEIEQIVDIESECFRQYEG